MHSNPEMLHQMWRLHHTLLLAAFLALFNSTSCALLSALAATVLPSQLTLLS
jgi:hypothetical protein